MLFRKNNQSNTKSSPFVQKALSNWLVIFEESALFIFMIYWGLTLCCYLPTIDSGFVTDVTGGIARIQNQPFWRVFHSFGFPALNQLSVFGFYLLYTIFGVTGFPWYLFFCSLHALNAFLSFVLFKTLFSNFEIKKATYISFLGALFFLVNPYQSEVLVWRACLNYLLVTAFTLASLIYLIQYLQTGQKRALLCLHFFFLVALFSFELGLVLSMLTLIFYLSWLWYFKKLASFFDFFKRISIPQFLLTAGYFVVHKLTFGSWIGHYGATTHLRFSLEEMANTLLKYILKYCFFVRSFSHTYKTAVFNYCDQYGLLILGIIIIGVLIFFFYRKRQEASAKINVWIVTILLGVSFSFTLLPVLNLFFYYLQWVENDRYGYLPSVFGTTLLIFLIFQLPKVLRYLLLILYFSVATFLLVQINQNWQQSSDVFYSLLEDYRWHDQENVVILNVPDNYNGAYLFRIIGKKSGFADALTYISGQSVKGKIWEVAQYNMVRSTDGVKVEPNHPHQLKITFNQWGNWFWRNGVGAGPIHQRELYTAHFKGQYYTLDLKNLPENIVFIYQDGKEWKEWDSSGMQ